MKKTFVTLIPSILKVDREIYENKNNKRTNTKTVSGPSRGR